MVAATRGFKRSLSKGEDLDFRPPWQSGRRRAWSPDVMRRSYG